MARWDAKWHTLSPRARLAYLKDVKVPQRAQRPNQKRPSVKADRFAASVLEELLAAGFVELGDSGSAGPRDRVFAVVAATDFATRVRALYRHHLLRGDLPSLLENYVRYCFYPAAAADALDSVLLHAGLQESLNLDETLRLYVVSHRWPGWVARSLKDPAAERIVELLRDANGPVRRAELEKKLPDIAADKLQAALGSLIAHLAVFEDLDPETFELVVGLLPSVRASMAAALLPRERPPLVVSENLQTIGPEGSIIVDDLRAFLLEVVAEPPRLRQDDEIFQNDLDRFLEALEELPASLMHALGLTQEKRLKQAQDWATGLALVGKRIQQKQRRLEILPRGSKWLSSSLDEQYGLVYDFLRPLPSDKRIYDTGISFLSSVDSLYELPRKRLPIPGSQRDRDQDESRTGRLATGRQSPRITRHCGIRSIGRSRPCRRASSTDWRTSWTTWSSSSTTRSCWAWPKRASRSSSTADRCRPWWSFENRQPGRYSRILFASD